MVNNALRAAYKRNNEWNGETGYYPDHERWLHWNEIIKRVGGQLWKVLEREDLREDREDDFLNHWQEVSISRCFSHLS